MFLLEVIIHGEQKLFFSKILESMNGDQETQVPGPYFQVPGHTPVIFSEVGRGKTLFRLLCRDAGGETEQMLLNETVPGWVVDVLVHVSIGPLV